MKMIMEIKVIRDEFSFRATLGKMFIDGVKGYFRGYFA